MILSAVKRLICVQRREVNNMLETILVVLEALMMLSHSAAEKLEYPYDLCLLVKLQLPELIVESDHSLRLHEKRGSR